MSTAPKKGAAKDEDGLTSKLKRVKKTKEDNYTPSKMPIETLEPHEDLNSQSTTAMFPEEDETIPEKTPKKRASRAKKTNPEKETAKKETSRSRPKKGEGSPKGKSHYGGRKKDNSKPPAPATANKPKNRGKGAFTEDEEDPTTAEGFEGLLFDDNNEQNDQHEANIPYWLKDEHILDAKGRRPDEEDYDPKTVFIPEIEYEQLPSVHKKYWQIKCKYFDKIVAFKMWACYFFYANDALLMHRLCDTNIGYYKGRVYSYCHEKPLLGKFVHILLKEGHKLVIIKQPDDDKEQENQKNPRDIFQIISRGTYMDSPDLSYASQYCLVLFERGDNIGLVYFDATTYEFYLGEFKDDENRSNLRTVLMKVKPLEVVFLRNKLSPITQALIKELPTKPTLTPMQIQEEKTKSILGMIDEISEYFVDKEGQKKEMPELLNGIKNIIELEVEKQMEKNSKEEQGASLKEENISQFFTLKALYITLNYLQDLILAENVFSMGTFNPYDLMLDKKSTLYLDGQALRNLEVLDVDYFNSVRENRSLLGYMDKTASQFGRRLFQKWLISPLLDPRAINERLEAVEDLLNNEGIADYFQSSLKELSDLERLITRIYSLGSKKRMTGTRFQEFVKSKLVDFLNVLEQLEKVEVIISRFEPVISKFKSERLKQLVTIRDIDTGEPVNKRKLTKTKKTEIIGLYPRIGPMLTQLKEMVYVKDGLLLPALGTNEEVEKIIGRIDEIKDRLQVILEEQRKFWNYRWLNYAHTKQRYELEIPEAVLEKTEKPREYVLTSKKKGFIRLHTPEIEEAVNELYATEYELQQALLVFIVGYFKMFYEKNMYWNQVVSCLAELDCLCSLAKFARTMPNCCRPVVLPEGDKPVFELREMVHPCIAPQNPDFVPNDFVVENGVDTFLITGPNMGGKSTLLRQICLATVMAQVGSYVPATSFKLSVVDRIFTRIGASDRITEGKSTFFVELEETKTILSEASKSSLIIIDELGRGTSTYDGVSIAYATLRYITENLKCINLFATHYHLLLEEFKLYKNVESYYMASEIDNEKEEIEFKYKFEKGQADKSYGVIIAKMAGIPQEVLSIAKERAEFMTNEKRNIGFEKSLADQFNNAIQQLNKVKEDPEADLDHIIGELCHL